MVVSPVGWELGKPCCRCVECTYLLEAPIMTSLFRKCILEMWCKLPRSLPINESSWQADVLAAEPMYCCWTGFANAAAESPRRIWKSSCLAFLLMVPSCVCPWPQRDLCHYFAGVLFDLRGLMAPTLMSESHPFLWKATKTRRHPPPAFTGRADRVLRPTETCVCCRPLPPYYAAAKNTELLNILNHFCFNCCLRGRLFWTLILALSGCL